MTNDIQKYRQEIELVVADKQTLNTLLETTFKGLTPDLAKRAMLEAMMRGFGFKNFLQKDIYAVPFKNRNAGTTEYSLVTSIDYARKIGMRSGICGKSEPKFEERDGVLLSCTITVERKIDEHIGKYSAAVYFNEYSTGQRLWATKPRTMLAKVAEMHALRMACPEELSQTYIEEEYNQDMVKGEIIEEGQEKIVQESKNKLEACKNMDELKDVWSNFPAFIKTELKDLKNDLKKQYDSKKV